MLLFVQVQLPETPGGKSNEDEQSLHMWAAATAVKKQAIASVLMVRAGL